MSSKEFFAAKKELDQAMNAICDYCEGEEHSSGMYETLVANLKEALAKLNKAIEKSDT